MEMVAVMGGRGMKLYLAKDLEENLLRNDGRTSKGIVVSPKLMHITFQISPTGNQTTTIKT
jgi:hypothetical protein